MISVLVLTRNEEADLPGCLGSVQWSDDIHVLDSFSTDGTCEIATKARAHVSRRMFTTYSEQRNAGLALPFRNDWVLVLDADERVPEELVAELRLFAATGGQGAVAARIRRRDFLYGRWLRHAQLSPYFIRLVRPQQVHYEREINEVLVPHGPVAELRGHFDHYPFSKGLAHWVDKHNRYSTMEAKKALQERADGGYSLRGALFARDFNVRRRHQKRLFYSMPARPLIKLVYIVLIRRAFLDGRAGMTYAWLQAYYEFLITQKEHELRYAAETRS